MKRASFYVDLYRLGVIDSGRVAALLGRDHSAFLDLLSAHGVSWRADHASHPADNHGQPRTIAP